MADAEVRDWDDLRILLAIARAGSLSEASRRLGLGQATVSRHLKALEERLGGALFDRLPNALALTSLGAALLPGATAMGEAADALTRAIAAAREAEPTPVVRISATTSVSLKLVGRLGELAAAGIVVELSATRDRVNLARREADIALRMRRIPPDGDLLGRRVGEMRFGLFASRDYLAAHPFDPAVGFAGHAVIGIPTTENTPYQGRWLDARCGEARVVARLTEVPLRVRAARSGVGIALLPFFLGEDDRLLEAIAPPPDDLTESIYMLIHADLRAVPAIRATAEAVAQVLAE
jgi:DNA-binding transcriptional LysR family regulator